MNMFFMSFQIHAKRFRCVARAKPKDPEALHFVLEDIRMRNLGWDKTLHFCITKRRNYKKKLTTRHTHQTKLSFS